MPSKNITKVVVLALLFGASLVIVGCTKKEKGTAAGAVLGGAAGAGIGAAAGGGTGAIIGGTAGAVGGGILGNVLTDDDEDEK
ncbi:hypothetical protein KAW80_02420 [Candidatus Babeliales bacterium]|nr:hypothetical protein [Candidatus Babeliales bacterium]